MTIYRLSADCLDEIPQTTFEEAGIKERSDLQRLIRQRIEVISPETLVISEEFSEWEGSSRRIDLLGIDRTGKIVVIELKRVQGGEHMELQALRYAAMVSAMTFEQAVEIYRGYLQKLNCPDDPQKSLLSFLGWTEPDEERFGQEVSIILAANDFTQELTTTVMWLLEFGLDIRCVRLRPHKHGDDILIDVAQVIPLPEATDYQVKLRDKRIEERKSSGKHDELFIAFWKEFLPKSRQKTDLHANISPTKLNWASAATGVSGVAYNCVLNKHRSYVELNIGTGDQDRNKRLFDALHSSKIDIEASFGGPLDWDRQDDNQRSIIKCDVADIGYGDESRWPELQAAMLDVVVRFEAAIQPKLNATK